MQSRILVIVLFTISMILSPSLPAQGVDESITSTFLPLIAKGFSCGSVWQIPKAECDALVEFYQSLGGDSWVRNDNWLKSATPCTDWYGVSCDNFHVKVLWFEVYKIIYGRFPVRVSNNMQGTLPASLGNLEGLTALYLALNQISGPIPSELGNLESLVQLNLADNQLSGSIPPELGDLGNLHQLILSGNSLNSAIPSTLGNLYNLDDLTLSRNQLSGAIPPELGNICGLNRLLLYENQLSGAIPKELGKLCRLDTLSLHKNQLSDPIPVELANLHNLRTLLLNDNQTSLCLPADLQEFVIGLSIYAAPTGGICVQ